MNLEKARVLDNQKILPQFWQLDLYAPKAAAMAQAGQFVMLQTTPYAEPFLKRPMSLNRINPEEGVLRIIYQIVGRGTKILTAIPTGGEIELIGPQGNGWKIQEGCQKALLVGGGAGIAPLLQLAINLTEKETKLDVLLGGSANDAIFNHQEFSQMASISVATMDGSWGHKGFVTDLLPQTPDYDMVYVCGPNPLMEKVALWAGQTGQACQVSLEERMGCGIGTCMGCVCKIKSKDGSIAYKRVCTDGPVFDGEEVIFNG